MKKKLLAAIVAAAMVFSMPMTASAVWQQDTQGSWQWVKNGIKQTGWKQIDGAWYFFDQNGKMQTDWVKDGGNWYYLDKSGAMKTGWQMISDQWYYLDENGKMAVNIEKDGYLINAIGIATKKENSVYIYSNILSYTYFYGEEANSQKVLSNDGELIGIQYRYSYSQEKAEGYQKYIENSGFRAYETFNDNYGGYVRSYIPETGKGGVMLTYNPLADSPFFEIVIIGVFNRKN